MESCSEGGRIRLICMGKGILQPDNITLEQCDIPVFKTHPTPVNVSVKPVVESDYNDLTRKSSSLSFGGGPATSNSSGTADTTCCCVTM